jgi:hypothetical protein
MPDLVPKYPLVTQAPTSDGLKITLSGLGNGLTVNKQGRPLLPHPFVFQCPPLDQFQIAHTFNFGTYDTIDNDQFIRRGSRQLDTWQFDTLAMYLGVDHRGHHAPSWVPFPRPEHATGKKVHPPEWYRGQLWDLLNAGSPFLFVAAFHRSTTIRRAFAVLTGFSEVYKHGEGDAIYFAGVSFSEWRDPDDATKKKRGHTKLPAHVRFRFTAGRYVAYEANTNHNIPTRGGKGSTLSDLARWFYGDGTKWRQIAKANKLKGGDGNTAIFKHWYPHRKAHGKPNVTMTIPKETPATYVLGRQR